MARPNINVLSQEEMEMWEATPPRGVHGAWLLPHTPEMRRLRQRVDTSLWAIPTVQHRSAALMKYYGGFEGAFRAGLVRATSDRLRATLFLEGTPEGIEDLKFDAIHWFEFNVSGSTFPLGYKPKDAVLDMHAPGGSVSSTSLSLQELLDTDIRELRPRPVEPSTALQPSGIEGYYPSGTPIHFGDRRPVHVRGHRRRA